MITTRFSCLSRARNVLRDPPIAPPLSHTGTVVIAPPHNTVGVAVVAHENIDTYVHDAIAALSMPWPSSSSVLSSQQRSHCRSTASTSRGSASQHRRQLSSGPRPTSSGSARNCNTTDVADGLQHDRCFVIDTTTARSPLQRASRCDARPLDRTDPTARDRPVFAKDRPIDA